MKISEEHQNLIEYPDQSARTPGNGTSLIILIVSEKRTLDHPWSHATLCLRGHVGHVSCHDRSKSVTIFKPCSPAMLFKNLINKDKSYINSKCCEKDLSTTFLPTYIMKFNTILVN